MNRFLKTKLSGELLILKTKKNNQKYFSLKNDEKKWPRNPGQNRAWKIQNILDWLQAHSSPLELTSYEKHKKKSLLLEYGYDVVCITYETWENICISELQS